MLTKFIYTVKDPFKSKYQLHINGREKTGIKKLRNSKGFIDNSQTIDDVYGNLEDYNPTRKRKVLTLFRMGFFGAAHGWGGRWGFLPPLP